MKWLVEWNFPDAKIPIVYRDFSVADDLTALATRDQTLTNIGYRPTAERVRDTYGDGYERIETAPPATSGDPSMMPAFAEATSRARRLVRSLRRVVDFDEARSAKDDIDDMLANDGWRRALGPEVDGIESLLADCSSLAEARDRLGELALRDPAQLTTSLAQIMFAARVGGNAEFEPDDDGKVPNS